jgi:hypothetical protein
MGGQTSIGPIRSGGTVAAVGREVATTKECTTPVERTTLRMARPSGSAERIALRILLGIAALELVPIVPPLLGIRWGFIGLPNLLRHPGPPLAWLLAAIVTAAYVGFSVRSMPALKENLGRGGVLKLAAIVLAIAAGITEEVVFRRVVVDAFLGYGALVAVLASAVTFGAAHGIWGFFGGPRVARGAMLWTGMLGAGLAIVYLVGGRALLPCIAAHTAIDVILEPGLVLAALSARLVRHTIIDAA